MASTAPSRTVKADRPEVAAFERLYPLLMPALNGKWVVMHGDGLAFVADTIDQAAEFAYPTYGPGNFIVAQLTPEPDPFGRDDDEDDAL